MSTTTLESIEVPRWISEVDVPSENDSVQEQQQQHVIWKESPTTRLNSQETSCCRMFSPLECLDPDASSLVLQHLSVQEIARLGTVSKAMYIASRHDPLWQTKFKARWNYDSSTMDWYQAYQQAYWNTDDLWVTHWNIVHPCDGLATGRTCVQEGPTRRKAVSSNKALTMCPTCRYHPTFHPSAYTYPTAITNEAEAIATATTIRLQQQRRFRNEYADVSPYSRVKAERAFAQSATLHRKIDTSQYQAESLNFVKDLLFFQVHDDPEELEDLKSLFHQDESGTFYLDDVNHLPEAGEVALHSWHICHFTNPDYKRPIVWRISIIRKDCFTVYPSEGHLRPGESQVVTFGVRPLGSLLAHATQQLNAHREGVDPFWARIYTEEAHLPPAPFLVHYHFATDREQPHQTGTSAQNPVYPANTPWQLSGKPDQPVRIMYLSAHVNDQYSLSGFQLNTSVPFSVDGGKPSIVYCAPQLREVYPNLAERLNGVTLEGLDQSTRAHSYRTEGPCRSCGITWGARMEELGQAFVLGRLECTMEYKKLEDAMQRIHTLLSTLLRNLRSSKPWTKRCHQLCVSIHDRLVELRAAPQFTTLQQRILSRWEAIVDFLCLRFTPLGDNEGEMRMDYFMLPWRHAGVYQNLLCTDSVFSGHSPLSDSRMLTFWKTEPRYLDAFAHLAHSPGRFSLGPQEDPNHLRGLPGSRYGRRQRGCVTDMFFDDPVCGLQAALCVVSAPRSLMVHGIWDRVAYPGTLTRRPKLIKLPELRRDINTPLRTEDSKLLLTKRRLYFELQTTLDMESLFLVETWCCGTEALDFCDTMTYPLSLRSFIRNVPPPGSGRFALSEVVSGENGRTVVQEVLLHVGCDSNAVDEPPLHSSGHRSSLHPLHPPGIHAIRPPGPRILNLLWILSAHMGWTVDDNQGTASVYVDRRILIGAQWLSISLMAAPLFWTLLARSSRWIPASPVDYSLEALPFHVETELRYLSESECQSFAFAVLAFWLMLGRHIERYTSRDFLRAMLEHGSTEPDLKKRGILSRLRSYVCLVCQRNWDFICPMFLQRAVFVPKWNRRCQDDLMKHIAFWRSAQGQIASTTFQSLPGGGFVLLDKRDLDIHLGEASRPTKILLSLLVSVASFTASSPHFFLNLLTVFSSSISLGLSMSLQSMETGRAGVTNSETGRILETLNLVTILIFSFLIGQLVGSSGGVLFLAEFVVTSISLVLGGAGTISANAMESWGTFFSLGVTAFWGYLFGRVSIMEGIKQKRSGFSSIMLCFSLFILALLWTMAMFVWNWESAVELVVDRAYDRNCAHDRWNIPDGVEVRHLQ